jgi:hypothetical protein
MPEVRSRILVQIYRYGLFNRTLGLDPSLAAALPPLIYPSAGGPGTMGTSDAYGIGDWLMTAASPAAATNFAAALLKDIQKGVAAPKSSAVDLQKAILFLKFHETSLGKEQQAVFDGLAAAEQKTDPKMAAIAKSLSDNPDPPFSKNFYAQWPAAGLNVLLVMTQRDQATDFIRYLIKNENGTLVDDIRPTDKSNPVEVEDLTLPFQKRVALHVVIFPDDTGGWTTNQAGVTRALLDGLTGKVDGSYTKTKYQAVFYRGHVGDYGYNQLSAASSSYSYKVFGDLGCYSETESQTVVANCKTCAYFGTTVVAEGERTDGFLPGILKALAANDSYSAMYQSLKRENPKTFYMFTGSYDPADSYAMDLFKKN